MLSLFQPLGFQPSLGLIYFKDHNNDLKYHFVIVCASLFITFILRGMKYTISQPRPLFRERTAAAIACMDLNKQMNVIVRTKAVLKPPHSRRFARLRN